MSDWKERLINENVNLGVNILQLRNFIGSEKFEALREVEKDDLTQQHAAMMKYKRILERRVQRIADES